MGIRKSVQEQFFVQGDATTWLPKVESAFHQQGFKNVRVTPGLGQVEAGFKPWIGTLYGDVRVTLVQHGQQTQFDVTATANVDNIFALGASPGKRLIDKLKDGLRSTDALEESTPVEVRPAHHATSVSDELAKLADLHARGLLDAEEFKAAKAKLLG